MLTFREKRREDVKKDYSCLVVAETIFIGVQVDGFHDFFGRFLRIQSIAHGFGVQDPIAIKG